MTDKERCPKCWSPSIYEAKSWIIESPLTGSKIRVKQMRCSHCKKGFRLTEKVD